ncbi:LysM peptidoglycan-binding domain-containing protein [Candidatus Mycolicibacterium alkanivorans]|uniref:LysM peptidoglycan-binding domain-containing protein n=1 Tax=Candidatus Mycolicibacterium alkanivorans TaxID=2954114 RepID=A0ABS9YYI3_9MYCO|nr:LysM peptidoglycan-binding domain-containing protein [Candidatus Mycolicibacterium alkanivorans]MCI4676291.1 LysM peptidoglycan-binding domain-containing protein [Candidatus Mycolicibacterium alkanivorans]
MTVIDDRQVVSWPSGFRPSRTPARQRPGSSRPGPSRPAAAPMRYRGTGVPVSQAVHSRRPVSTAVTIALAGLAALITLWLGSLAHFSSGAVAPAQIPDQLAVVQVQAGESLEQVAARAAPDAPVSQVVQRIRDLNKLDSASLDAGQTLIAPIG